MIELTEAGFRRMGQAHSAGKPQIESLDLATERLSLSLAAGSLENANLLAKDLDLLLNLREIGFRGGRPRKGWRTIESR
jgi:hypothetical protein